MHRNTLVVVSILAVFAALVIGVNYGKKIAPPAKPDPTPIETPIPTDQTFVNTPCGFSLEYPSDFTLIDSGSGSAVLKNATSSVQPVIMTCQKAIPRPALPSNKIDAYIIPTTLGATISAKLYHDQSAKDGTPIDALIFVHPTTKTDIFLAGFGPEFTKLLTTIQVIP